MKQQRYVALYARCSTKHQEKGLETQERLLEKYCEQNGIEKYKLFSDFSYSGASSSRPQLDLLMGEVREERICKIIIPNLSRISRSLKHLLTIIDELQRFDVEFISISESFCIKDSYGRLIVQILSALSEMERSMISEKTKQGLFNAREKGIPLGRKRSLSHEKIIQTSTMTDLSVRAIAKIHGCSPSSVSRILSNHKKNQENK